MTAELCQARDIDVFAKHLPMDWVAEAVQQTQTGRASLRTRFPAEQAVWLVLGIGLMRNRSIQQVCDKLSLAFPYAKGDVKGVITSCLCPNTYPYLSGGCFAQSLLAAQH
ncbi:MAG: transposase domain-containing protein [Shewanella sp.]|nr:transposase domain-containing protein [Shewanella sp.]